MFYTYSVFRVPGTLRYNISKRPDRPHCPDTNDSIQSREVYGINPENHCCENYSPVHYVALVGNLSVESHHALPTSQDGKRFINIALFS